MWVELKESVGNKIHDLLNINNIEDYTLMFFNEETFSYEHYNCDFIVKVVYYDNEGYLIIYFKNGDVKLHDYDSMSMLGLKKNDVD